MNKLITLFPFLFAATFVSAQSFEFTYTAPFQWGDANTLMTSRAHLKNNSGSSKDVKALRSIISEVPGSINYFCWDVCYGPSTNVALNPLTVPAGAEVQNFYGDYEPYGNLGTTTIKYCFFDQQNINDSICYIAVYTASPTGVETDFIVDANVISNAFPNPASHTTKLKYSVKSTAGAARLEIHNMLGAAIKTIELKEKYGTIEIPLEQLQAGIYFYSLKVDNNIVSTKKLTVAK